MSAPHLLAVDLGAESGRTILGALDHGKLTLSEVSRFANGGVQLPDGYHWDALRLFSEIKNGIAQAWKLSNGQLAGIGIDTWGVDYGLLDRQGALLGNPYHYRDSRTDGMMEAAFSLVSKEEIYRQTGIQFMQLNTLFQLFSMASASSPQLAAADCILPMPDLLNYWLTGEKGAEFTIATTTQCFDTRRRVWADDMLEALGIPKHIFPEVHQPATRLGVMLPPLAAELDVRPISVLLPASHDTGSAVAAVPARGQNFAWISSGTWSIMGVNSPEAVITPQSLAAGLTNEGGINQSYRLSKNIMGLWLVQECRRTWRRANVEYSYAELTEMAAQAKPLVAVLDPDSPEFLKPGDMPTRIRAFCQSTGQTVPESDAQLVRVILEGLALKYRWTLEQLEEITGQRYDTIHIVGGGTQNRLLSQFTANATGRQVITGPVEATAIGNLLCQFTALGEIQLSEIADVVCRSFEVETFEPVSGAAWDDAYQKMCELCQSSN